MPKPPTSFPPPDRGERPPARDLLLVVGVAAAIRLLYLLEYRASPFFDFIHLDPRYYRDWALEIAGGSWLGHDVFEQSPLYPYLLAVYFLIFGHGLTILRVLQLGVGCATAALTALLGRRLFGRTEGLLAGLGAAAYGPFLFYEGQVMKEFLTPFLSAAALLLVYRGLEGRRRPTLAFAAAGAAIGTAALVRDNVLLLTPILAGFLVLARYRAAPGAPLLEGPRGSRARLAAAAALVAGTLVPLLPVAARNAAVAGELVLTTSGGGEVFYIGNGPYANGAYIPPPWVRANPRYEHEDFRARARAITGRDLTRGEASRFWWREGLRAILDDPARWLRLEARKAALFLNDHELPDNYSYGSFKRFSWTLTLALTLGPLVVLAAPGLLLERAGRRAPLAPLLLAGAGYMASVMLFFNFARFRLPAVPILLVLAAHGAVALARALRGAPAAARDRRPRSPGGAAAAPDRRRGGPVGPATAGATAPRPRRGLRRLALPLAAAAAAGVLAYVDLSSDVEEPFGDRLHLGAAYRDAGRLDEAESILRATIRDAQAVLEKRGWRPGMGAVPGGVTFAIALHAAHRDLSGILLQAGRTEEAIAEMEAAMPLDPNDADLLQRLGGAHRDRGDLDAAVAAYRRGLAVKPGAFTLRFDLATALHERGEAAAALHELEEARRLNPTLPPLDLADWNYGMGAVLLDMPGRREEAVAYLREGLRLNPAHPQAAEVRSRLGL